MNPKLPILPKTYSMVMAYDPLYRSKSIYIEKAVRDLCRIQDPSYGREELYETLRPV